MHNIGINSQEFKEDTNVKDWPIEPTFLSIRDGINKYASYSPNKDGLFDAYELRGILANASATIGEVDGKEEQGIGTGQNFALFQVVPETFEALGVNDHTWFVDIKKEGIKSKIIKRILEKQKEKILRIHPGALYPNLPYCDFFRECKYKDNDKNDRPCSDKCFEMDSRIALLYDPDLPALKMQKEEYDWTDFNKKLDEIINGYNNNEISDKSYRLERKKTARPCVGYRCLYSGLMEYFAPIIHDGKVVAVLMHGQCAPEGLKPKDMFKGYYKGKYWSFLKNSKSPEKKLSKSINTTYKDERKKTDLDKKFFNLSEKDFKEREKNGLQIFSKKIEELEEKIDDIVKARS